MQDKKIPRTASVFILNNHKLLLLLRDNKPEIPNPNTWGLIGGFANENENEEDAVRREAEEEVGINLGQLFHIGTHKYESGRKTTMFLTVIKDSEVSRMRLGNEGQEVRFFSFGDLANIPLSGSIKRYYNDHQDELRVMMEAEKPKLIE